MNLHALTSATAPNPVAIARNRPIFYTRVDSRDGANPVTSAVSVALWLSHSSGDGKPSLEGHLGNHRVQGFLVQRSTAQLGGCVAFVPAGQPFDSASIVATGLIMTSRFGVPLMAIKMAGLTDSLWAEVSPAAPQSLLVAAGLDLDRMGQKRSATAHMKRKP